jgi:hypothetical protein
MNVPGTGGDGDVGRATDIEGAVEVAVGGECGCGGESEGCGGGGEDFNGHGIPLVNSDSCDLDAGPFEKVLMPFAHLAIL